MALNFEGFEAAVSALEAAGAAETTEVTAIGEQYRANEAALNAIIADLRSQLGDLPAAQAKLDELSGRVAQGTVLVQAMSDAINPVVPTPDPPVDPTA